VSPDLSGPLPGPATPQVNAALRARLEHLLTEYDQMRGNLAQLRQRLAAAEGEAMSQDGSVRVTVGPQGQLRALEITPRAYRHLSPSELAAEIVRLADEATTKVREQLQEVMAPFLPAGVSYADAASGTVDPATLAPSRPLTPETVDDWLASLGQRAQGNQGHQPSQGANQRKAGQ
jgi:DNA-binding protein YbaB